MEKDEIILSYKGDITKDLLSSVYQIIEVRMESENEDPRRKKKFFHVLVECLQNMYNHMEHMQHSISGKPTDYSGSAIFIIKKGDDLSYRIITGNFIQNDNAELLKGRMDKINGMNEQELRAYYLETLNTTELSEKGGAGLGIIDIARKSGNKIEYDFKQLSGGYSFITLSVKIN
jgi:hypothetical protein